MIAAGSGAGASSGKSSHAMPGDSLVDKDPDFCAAIIQKRWREIRKKKQQGNKRNKRSRGDAEKLSKIAKWQMTFFMLMDRPTSSWLAAMINRVIVFSICISIISFTLETMPELWYHVTYHFWFTIEMTCTFIFTIEFAIRLWCCRADENVKSRWHFFFMPLNLFDILAILPFYVDRLAGVAMGAKEAKSLRVLRVFRIVRVFRVFKLGRHSRGIRLMYSALSNSLGALVVLLFFLSIAVILFSACVYYLEKIACIIDMEKPYEEIKDDIAQMELECAQNLMPKIKKGFWSKGLCCDEYGSPNDFPSIVHAFWWCIVTMITVGYGDVYPRTTQGRLVAAVAILNGILVIALPVAIVSRRFQEVYDEDQKMEEEMKQLERAWALERDHSEDIESPKNSSGGRKKSSGVSDPFVEAQDMSYISLNDESSNALIKNISSFMCDYQDILTDHCRIEQSLSRRKAQLNESMSDFLDLFNSTTHD